MTYRSDIADALETTLTTWERLEVNSGPPTSFPAFIVSWSGATRRGSSWLGQLTVTVLGNFELEEDPEDQLIEALITMLSTLESRSDVLVLSVGGTESVEQGDQIQYLASTIEIVQP